MRRYCLTFLISLVLFNSFWQPAHGLVVLRQPHLTVLNPIRSVEKAGFHAAVFDSSALPEVGRHGVAASQVYLPLVLKNDAVCGQFVWFRLGIDRYPGFQRHDSSELWFFDEFSLGTMPAEGSYGLIINPQFMNEDFTPGIRWLMGASAITLVGGC